MKLNVWKVAFAALLFVSLQSCGGDDPTPTPPKTPEQIATEALTGTGAQTWGIAGGGRVTRRGNNVTDLYSTFELILNSGSSKTYTTRNSNDLFDANGNWAFAGTNFDKITLTGTKPAAAREMSFTQTGTNLKLVFSIPAPGARINGQFAIAGDYVFDLIKK
ncbi:hypothetical protein SAMN03080617_02588 [Algoriphagus alkaliphilus]|uniref:Lipocalin-like domain-containing protein n=1 Tax=Algoriphagus alkaliphilus TaxID=279824 RepID=A0A1G5YIE2_9BACT|nr:hypothetical protein [Algoriphagus alkaliphilus]SDA82528.1 hypothetical protein SAMN03080617_02588 [Algoriphagus alkaliphilus]